MNLFFCLIGPWRIHTKHLKNLQKVYSAKKDSRFLAFGFPVQNEEEIKNILAGIRKKYHDARHHCYAYRLGQPEGNLQGK